MTSLLLLRSDGKKEDRLSPQWLDAVGETGHRQRRFRFEWSADINSRQETM